MLCKKNLSVGMGEMFDERWVNHKLGHKIIKKVGQKIINKACNSLRGDHTKIFHVT